MKGIKIILCILPCILLCGCKDDIAAAGAGALTDDEEVRVCVDTLEGTLAYTIDPDSLGGFEITQTPDSFLLGECNTQEWATIKADLMTQFACPEGFVFPPDVSDIDTTSIDSAVLFMSYGTWFAEGNSPLRISVYEMDLSTFEYTGVYSCNEGIEKYISTRTDERGHIVVDENTHIVKEDQVVVAAQPKDSVYSSSLGRYIYSIRFNMDDKFVKKMNCMKHSLNRFPSQSEFNNIFKGLYITTTSGASTALYVGNITLVLYYHYYYEETPGSGKYTKVDHVKYLYANNEVRQVNRYSFPYRDRIVEKLKKEEDSVNYVVSPGYVYTTIKIPMSDYVDTILQSLTTEQGDTLQPYINKAMMRVDVLNVENNNTTSDKWADPAPDMLLICKDSLQSFFSHNTLPSSDYCLLSSLSQGVDNNNNSYYYYNFDVSTLLYNEVHKRMTHAPAKDMEMVMIPVSVEYTTTSSSTYVSKVKINQTITFTRLGKSSLDTHCKKPWNIDIVFSGFTINKIH